MASRSPWSWVIWCLAGGCLAAALGVSVLVSKENKDPPRRPLAAALPREIAGWRSEDLPLGDTEVTNATTKLLNYDDYIYRVYRRAGAEVFVYAMYWKQGSISVREIAGHTPDGCWVANGAEFSAPKATTRFIINGRMTAPAESREFVFSGGQHVHVAWWHLWGENLVDRGFDRKTLVPTLRELWVWLAKRGGARHDQLLLRIHTNDDLSAAVNTEPAASLLELFPEIYSAKPL